MESDSRAPITRGSSMARALFGHSLSPSLEIPGTPKVTPQQNGWFFCALGGWWLWMAAPYTSGLKATSKHLWNYLLRWPDGSSYIGNFEANNLPEPYIQQTSADKCANKLTVSVELRCDPCRQERHWYVFMGRWPELHWSVGSLIWAFPKIGGTPKASILIYSVGFSMKKNNFWYPSSMETSICNILLSWLIG